MQFSIYLSDKKHIFERTKYSLFMLFSDFGGFLGAIIMIPQFIIGLYAPKMLAKSIAAQTPIAKKRYRINKENIEE